jgi:hypothetical protein
MRKDRSGHFQHAGWVGVREVPGGNGGGGSYVEFVEFVLGYASRDVTRPA